MVEYRELEQYPGYRFGSDGSVERCVGETWEPVPSRLDRSGYRLYHIKVDGKHLDRRGHRLILEAFVGLRPAGMVCRHLNGDPADNRIENLQWGTYHENAEDARKHGTAGCQLSVEEIERVRDLRAKGARLKDLARQFGVSTGLISGVIARKVGKYAEGAPYKYVGRGHYKLNESQVIEIRRLRREGATYKAIAMQFGMDKTSISDLIRGITWGHVAG